MSALLPLMLRCGSATCNPVCIVMLIKSISFLSLVYSNHDIYKSSGVPKDAIEIKTFYELKFLKLDKPITYIQFEFIENGK